MRRFLWLVRSGLEGLPMSTVVVDVDTDLTVDAVGVGFVVVVAVVVVKALLTCLAVALNFRPILFVFLIADLSLSL